MSPAIPVLTLPPNSRIRPRFASYSMTKFDRTSGSRVVATGCQVWPAVTNSHVAATRELSAMCPPNTTIDPAGGYVASAWL